MELNSRSLTNRRISKLVKQWYTNESDSFRYRKLMDPMKFDQKHLKKLSIVITNNVLKKKVSGVFCTIYNFSSDLNALIQM